MASNNLNKQSININNSNQNAWVHNISVNELSQNSYYAIDTKNKFVDRIIYIDLSELKAHLADLTAQLNTFKSLGATTAQQEDVLSDFTYYQSSLDSNGESVLALKTGSMQIWQYDSEGTTSGGPKYETGRTIYPGITSQYITASTGFDAIKNLTVAAVPTEEKTVNANGTVTPTSGKFLTKVIVNVPTGSTISNQNKTVTPTTSEQYVSADSGYTGLGTVTVEAMPSGTAGTPTATKGTVSNHSISITPKVANTTGYIAGGTKTGTAITVAASELVSGNYPITENGTNIDVTNYKTVSVNVPSSGGTGTTIRNQDKSVALSETAQSITADTGYTGLGTVTVPGISSTYVGSGVTKGSSSSLTVSGETVTVPAGFYASQVTKSVATGTAGTPSASKGTVSNHSISITPTVTNTTGYITGGTKTGTAVTVSASELVSGSETKTENGTYDVTNLQTLVVDVPTSSGGDSKNVQCYQGYATVSATAYTATSVSLTVAKTGTYKVSWTGWRNTNSGTSGSQLYIGNTAYGSANTSFLNTYGHSVTLNNVSLTEGQTIVVRARARSTSYVMAVGNLTIVEQ